MGYTSQAGQLGLKTQSVKGTYLNPGAVAPNQGVFLRYTSGSLGGNRDLLVPDPEIGGNRDIPDAALGPVSFSGEFNAYARMEALATLLYGALGTKAAPTGDADSGYTHVITPGDTIPWISVEEKIANGYEVFNYTDAKVNTLHIEADAAGYVMVTFGLIALKQTAGNTATAANSQRVDTSPLLLGTSVGLTYGGTQLPAKSFSLDINNNLEDDDFRLGSLFLGDLVEKRRELTMATTIRPNDHNLWRQAMYGSSAATQAIAGRAAKDEVVITIESYEDIAGADPGTPYTLEITVPTAAIAPFTPSPSGDDVLQHDLEIRALRPDPADPLISAAITNSYATVA
jgi:hypothetical protein